MEFAPSQASGTTEDKTTDYFDFVVSPPPHCPSTDGGGVGVDEDAFLHRATAGCRTTLGYLSDVRLHDGFVKETNNNTLTALPPVSTITGHIHSHNQRRNNHGCLTTATAPVSMDTSNNDCDYWTPEDTKEHSILLEDLNKYCSWSQDTSSPNEHTGLLVQRRDSPLADGLTVQHRDATGDDRQNTDGAIYTLTVLNSEANSMDDLDCCKSPTSGTGADGWTLRPNHLDLDAILNMESSVSIGGNGDGGDIADREHHDRQVVVTANGTTIDRYGSLTATQYATTDDQQQTTTFGVTAIKQEPGDNNNDWKLSDRNSLQEAVTVSESAAESLLRNALQGKLYPATTTTAATTALQAARILEQQQSQQGQDEAMQTVTEQDLLLSQLDVETYRSATGDYEKLKSIANEVVESYCNLEPVSCNVSAATTVMYTLDPASGSLGTITLPADLAQVGTVTVVTTAPPQQDILTQDSRQDAQPPTIGAQMTTPTTGTQLQLTGSSPAVATTSGGRAPGTKPKKYVRRANRNSANGPSSSGSGGGSNATVPGNSTTGGGGNNSTGGNSAGGNSPSPVQRKERSLHYCSICSKGFKDKYSVNVHIRTHTGEKPFNCTLCGKSFRQKAHLAKHYQTHVTQKPSVAAAAAAAAAAAGSGASNGASSNGATALASNTNSNSGSARSTASPTTTTTDLQQQIAAIDSPMQVAAAACNPSS